MSSEASDPSVGIQYEMEDESQENRNCQSIDFACSDADADSNTDIKAYFVEPIADEASLDNYRKKREEDRERRKDFELRWDGTKPVSTGYNYKINLFPLYDWNAICIDDLCQAKVDFLFLVS